MIMYCSIVEYRDRAFMSRSASSRGVQCDRVPPCSVDIAWQCFLPVDQLEKQNTPFQLFTSNKVSYKFVMVSGLKPYINILQVVIFFLNT